MVSTVDVSAGDVKWSQAMGIVSNAADPQKVHSELMLAWGEHSMAMYWWTMAENYFAVAAEGFELAADMYDVAAAIAGEAEQLYREAE